MSEDPYASNFDDILASVESLEDPTTMEKWNTSLMGDAQGPMRLPNYVPCRGHLRELKKCLRHSPNGISSCFSQLSDFEKCTGDLFREVVKQVGNDTCENEKRDFFAYEIKDIPTLREAKKRWKAFFECAKIAEGLKIEGAHLQKEKI